MSGRDDDMRVDTPLSQTDIKQLREENKLLSRQLIDLLTLPQLREHHTQLFDQIQSELRKKKKQEEASEKSRKQYEQRKHEQEERDQRDKKTTREVIQEADIDDLKEIFEEKGIPYDEGDTIKVLREKLLQHLNVEGGGKRRKKRKSSKKRKSKKRKSKKRKSKKRKTKKRR